MSSLAEWVSPSAWQEWLESGAREVAEYIDTPTDQSWSTLQAVNRTQRLYVTTGRSLNTIHAERHGVALDTPEDARALWGLLAYWNFVGARVALARHQDPKPFIDAGDKAMNAATGLFSGTKAAAYSEVRDLIKRLSILDSDVELTLRPLLMAAWNAWLIRAAFLSIAAVGVGTSAYLIYDHLS